MIYLIRQGQTDWNLFHRFNGITETFLNQTGIKQAEECAKKLSTIVLDYVISSPQKRAVQTYEIISKAPLVLDDRLAEIICGEFEGLEESRDNLQAFWKASRNGEKGAERMDSFIKKNCEFCEDMEQKYQGKNILIITHAANASVIDYYFKGKPKDYDFRMGVAKDVSILTYEND